jgi:hypothetical protein
MGNLIDANDPMFLLGVMQNVEQRISKKERKSYSNLRLVQLYLMNRTSKSGSTSCWEMCEYIGVDPDGYSFFE